MKSRLQPPAEARTGPCGRLCRCAVLVDEPHVHAHAHAHVDDAEQARQRRDSHQYSLEDLDLAVGETEEVLVRHRHAAAATGDRKPKASVMRKGWSGKVRHVSSGASGERAFFSVCHIIAKSATAAT